MKRADLVTKVLDYLEPLHSDVETELDYGSTFQLLVAVVLSAQCTDKRVNLTTPALFEAYPNAEAMSRATADDILPYIRSISYPNSKAAHLATLSRQLMERHGGEVPHTLDELTALTGVGRKTANVVLAVGFGQAALAVDTHIFRVSHRLNLVPATADTPYKVEVALRKNIPDERVAKAHFWLLLHGRYTCTARQPKCDACGLTNICQFFCKNIK